MLGRKPNGATACCCLARRSASDRGALIGAAVCILGPASRNGDDEWEHRHESHPAQHLFIHASLMLVVRQAGLCRGASTLDPRPNTRLVCVCEPSPSRGGDERLPPPWGWWRAARCSDRRPMVKTWPEECFCRGLMHCRNNPSGSVGGSIYPAWMVQTGVGNWRCGPERPFSFSFSPSFWCWPLPFGESATVETRRPFRGG